MQGMNSSTTTQAQISLQDLQQQSFMDPQSSSHDDFLEQMLSTLGPPQPSWPHHDGGDDPNSVAAAFHTAANNNFDLDSLNLASKLRNHHIASKSMMLHHHHHHHMTMPRPDSGPEPGLIPMPLTLSNPDFDRSHPNDVVVDPSPFRSPGSSDGPVQGLYNNGFGSGSLPSPNQFHNPQNYGGPSPAMNQAPAPSSSSGGAQPAQPRPRVRARRGQATDPHSIAERLRRERIAERMKALQELVPNGNKTDKASMLDEIIDYVKFLQLQVKVLSMSRLGGAAAVAPLVADMSSEGGGDCIQTNTGNGGVHRRSNSSGGINNASPNETMTVTEHQVAKLMEEDMGSAMQYLQGKGLCLMPISLATAISTATCHSRNPLINNANPLIGGTSNGGGGADGPASPSMSVLTVQSVTAGNGISDGTIKDAASVSKP